MCSYTILKTTPLFLSPFCRRGNWGMGSWSHVLRVEDRVCFSCSGHAALWSILIALYCRKFTLFLFFLILCSPRLSYHGMFEVIGTGIDLSRFYLGFPFSHLGTRTPTQGIPAPASCCLEYCHPNSSELPLSLEWSSSWLQRKQVKNVIYKIYFHSHVHGVILL